MFAEALYHLTIRPLEILFETVFFILFRLTGKPLFTIVGLSIFVNILVLPLYRRADRLQSEQRSAEKQMEKSLSHIKKTFKGDEKVMMTQAYYRISGYKPIFALKGASSLLLQIPFFIAAYRFLSGVSVLDGMPSLLVRSFSDPASSFFLIKDLGAPDGALSIGGISINVLPVLMTLINIISGTVYSRDHLVKEKVQLIVTALVFLVLLYNSPSGLVLYWTFNNIFSLCKNVVQKVAESRKAGAEIKTGEGMKAGDVQTSSGLFFSCSFFMALLTGLYIPSNLLASSATEFINPLKIFDPSLYLVYSLFLGMGVFVVWMGIYYLFSDDKKRRIFSAVMTAVCACAFADYLLSGHGLGKISAELKYDNPPAFATKLMALNLLLIAVLSFASVMTVIKKSVFARSIVLTGCAAMICISFVNVHGINLEYKEYEKIYSSSADYDLMPEITLSRTGKNVVVIMLDRSLGAAMMYELNERPDLANSFDGFTYYHDTISFGSQTNLAMPAVFGGYEYMPHELNKRASESLEEKTNEALKVLPVLFLNNGYGVTVMDPPYAGYQETPDLSIFDDYPDIKKYISNNKLNSGSEEMSMLSFKRKKRNMFYYAFMKTVPLPLQGVLYDDGNYNMGQTKATGFTEGGDESLYDEELGMYVQRTDDLIHAEGVSSSFMGWYSVLENLSGITNIKDEDKGQFLMMYNAASHESTLLQMPDYTPAAVIDNSLYYSDDNYVIGGAQMHLDTERNRGAYHANMASLLRLGEWFDYLRSEGVYDNTRIIIVSDHGDDLHMFWGFAYGEEKLPCERFLPLFMVKDFDSHGFNISTDFMTNADTCVMAASGGVVGEAVNPFTGKKLDGHEKDEETLWITASNDWSIKINNGNTFLPADWYTVSGSPYDVNSWEYLGHE